MGMRLLRTVLLLAALSRSADAQPASSQNVWGSLGVGGSAKGLVLMASASYSRGPFVVIGRGDGVGALMGPWVSYKSLLAGARTGKGRRFSLAAIGIGRSHPVYSPGEVSQTVLAFQVQAQPDFAVTPLGMTILGAAGRGNSSYLGAALSLDLGWFGDESLSLRRR